VSVTRSTENVANKQKNGYKPLLDWILKLICFNEFGEWYEDLYIDFNPLDEMSDEEIANINKTKAETYSILIADEVITPEQAHKVLASDEDSGFNGVPYVKPVLIPGFDDEDKDTPPGTVQQ
jgi:hypothetical protein